MPALQKELPTDLLDLLESNFRQGKPLLEDAVLYRGSRLPDQTQGSFSKEVMHGSLLPQVAASYTHNWDEKTSFIGTYPVDRNTTKFFPDFGMEKVLDGKPMSSLSVADAEKALQPYVREFAAAKPGTPERRTAEAKLEGFVKQALYEANIPTRTPAGGPHRPLSLYAYTGNPKVAIRQAVGLQMRRVDPLFAQKAKEVVYAEHRNAVGAKLHQLASDNPGKKFLRVIQSIAQREYGDALRAAHDEKPLNSFLDAVAKHPVAEGHARLGQFAQKLVEGMSSPNKDTQLKAHAMAEGIAQLNPETARASDVVRAATRATESLGLTKDTVATKSHGTESVKDLAKQDAMPAPTRSSPAPSRAAGMAR